MVSLGTSNERALELLEREDEIGKIGACLDDACKGAGRMLFVEGVAGIGKTRLLRRARELARERGMRVLTARATELEHEFAFGVVRQLLEPVLFASTVDERERLFESAAGDAAAVFERGSGEPEATAGSDTSFAILGGLYWMVANLAEAGPLALIVDDLQWCDRSSQRFLRFVLPRLDGLAVALIVASRPAESALLDEMTADAATLALRPAPLSPNAVGSVVRARIDSAAEDAFCAACCRASGGNPFLLGELLGELKAGGSGGTAADIAAVHDVAPQSVQRAVVGRIDRLGGDVGATARAIAVLGEGAAPSLIARMAELDEDVSGAAADALAAAGILEPGRPARFVHPMIRNAVYGNLGRADVAEAHARAAALLRHDGAESERIAVHLLRTDGRHADDVSETLIEAARQASARGAPDAAVSYLRHVLAEAPVDDRRPEVVGMLISASRAAVEMTALEDVCTDPLAELGADVRPSVTHDLAGWLHMKGRIPDALVVLDRAIARADETGDIAAVFKLESLRTLVSQTPPTASRERIEQHAAAVQPGSVAESLLLSLRAHWMSLTGESAEETSRLTHRALNGGRIFVDCPGLVAPTYLPFVLLLTDELDEAQEAFSHWHAATRNREGMFGAAAATAGQAYMALQHGDVALAEAGLRAGLELVREAGSPILYVEWTGALIETLIERGDEDAADHELRTASLDRELPDGHWGTEVRLARGRLRLAQGRADAALEDFLEVRAYTERTGEANPAWLPWASAAAPALMAAGRTEEARAYLEDELVRARRWGSPAPIGRTLRTLGALEGDLALLREATTILDSSPRRLEHLRALCELGGALRRQRQSVAAREPLRAALAEARRRGALAIAQRAADELAATGETVRAPLAVGLESLTPSERRIAGVAARGMSNREIAQALFLSVKTVETHLSAVYRKLDIAGRGELAQVLER